MTVANCIFLSISTVATLLSGLYLLYKGIGKRSYLWTSARLVYIILGIVELYYFTIYSLVLTGLMPFASYAGYIRPIAFIMLLSPALMAVTHRHINIKLPLEKP
jgi:hypothetical protein